MREHWKAAWDRVEDTVIDEHRHETAAWPVAEKGGETGASTFGPWARAKGLTPDWERNANGMSIVVVVAAAAAAAVPAGDR